MTEQPAKSLSGGNQQKVVVAKWLMSRPAIFIMDEPTRGVDVGAKYEIYTIINDLAAQGSGVLFISSELEELMGMCDRILVMSRGEIHGEFTREEFDEEQILRAAFERRTGHDGQDARAAVCCCCKIIDHSVCAIFSCCFGLQSSRFLQLQNLQNILKQSSFIGILAVGMTFVLLTAASTSRSARSCTWPP